MFINLLIRCRLFSHSVLLNIFRRTNTSKDIDGASCLAPSCGFEPGVERERTGQLLHICDSSTEDGRQEGQKVIISY